MCYVVSSSSNSSRSSSSTNSSTSTNTSTHNKNNFKHKQNNKQNNKKTNNHKHIGGSSIGDINKNNKNEKFEVTTLSNVDANKFSVSKYMNANIDWGIMPGPPPTDCCIC